MFNFLIGAAAFLRDNPKLAGIAAGGLAEGASQVMEMKMCQTIGEGILDFIRLANANFEYTEPMAFFVGMSFWVAISLFFGKKRIGRGTGIENKL